MRPFGKGLGHRIILHMQKSKCGKALLWVLAFGLLTETALFTACAEGPQAPATPVDPVLRARRERDIAFKSDPQSPIPAQDRTRFQGLEYFPLNPDLRFRVQLNRYPVPERIRMATNTGEVRDGLKYGYFEFRAGGVACRLQVYRLDDNDNPGQPSLFIPFRDATTGKETYAAGRYLDLRENTSGLYDLDFNRAYNPSCAYGGDFSCPIPPEENRLSIQIRSGDKDYPHAPIH